MLTHFLYIAKKKVSIAKRFMVDEHMHEAGKLMAFRAILYSCLRTFKVG